MSFLCEVCCPGPRSSTSRKQKTKKVLRDGSGADDPGGGRRLKTFEVPDSFSSKGAKAFDEDDEEQEEDEDSDIEKPLLKRGGQDQKSSTSGSSRFALGSVPEKSGSSPSLSGPPLSKEEEAAQKQTTRELKKIARRIEGPIQKHPKSGKGFFKKVQDRYIAVVQNHELQVPNCTDMMRWKAGTLAWWESLEAFRTGGMPKGNVPLLKIAKVDISRDDKTGKSVVVKHKHGNIMQELVLVFSSNRDAEEWSYALWELISVVRGITSVSGPSEL